MKNKTLFLGINKKNKTFFILFLKQNIDNLNNFRKIRIKKEKIDDLLDIIFLLIKKYKYNLIPNPIIKEKYYGY